MKERWRKREKGNDRELRRVRERKDLERDLET